MNEYDGSDGGSTQGSSSWSGPGAERSSDTVFHATVPPDGVSAVGPSAVGRADAPSDSGPIVAANRSRSNGDSSIGIIHASYPSRDDDRPTRPTRPAADASDTWALRRLPARGGRSGPRIAAPGSSRSGTSGGCEKSVSSPPGFHGQGSTTKSRATSGSGLATRLPVGGSGTGVRRKGKAATIPIERIETVIVRMRKGTQVAGGYRHAESNPGRGATAARASFILEYTMATIPAVDRDRQVGRGS